MARYCDICGGNPNFAEQTIVHRTDCPHHPDAIDDTPQPVPSNVASFSLAKAVRSRPREHGAMEALALAREWIETYGPADHVIVFIGKTNDDNSSGTKYFQTGSFSAHAQAGLIVEGMDMLRNSG